MRRTRERIAVLATAGALSVAALSGVGFAQEYPPGEDGDGVEVAPTEEPTDDAAGATEEATTGETDRAASDDQEGETVAELPATGVDDGMLALTGGAIAAAGAGALVYARRRAAEAV